jgi:putative FmdB family regulatory protein
MYEYDCLQCEKELTVMLGMDERPTIICPDCGSTMTKVYSFGISFKGSGFYSTDK